MASSEMGRRFARKSRHEVNSAAGNSSGGRKKRKTSSGSSRTLGSPGIKAEQQSADDKQNGIRDVQLPRDQRQHGHGQQQSHENFNHAIHSRPSLTALAFTAMIAQSLVERPAQCFFRR